MMHTNIKSTLVTAALVSGIAAMLPLSALAREGAQSVGKGLKCYTAAVLQSNGTVKYEHVCYKGV